MVTDATAGLGMAPGRYSLGGRDVDVDGTSVRLVDDGRLAGSALTADQAFRSLVAMTGWPPLDAVRVDDVRAGEAPRASRIAARFASAPEPTSHCSRATCR